MNGKILIGRLEYSRFCFGILWKLFLCMEKKGGGSSQSLDFMSIYQVILCLPKSDIVWIFLSFIYSTGRLAIFSMHCKLAFQSQNLNIKKGVQGRVSVLSVYHTFLIHSISRSLIGRGEQRTKSRGQRQRRLLVLKNHCKSAKLPDITILTSLFGCCQFHGHGHSGGTG